MGLTGKSKKKKAQKSAEEAAERQKQMTEQAVEKEQRLSEEAIKEMRTPWEIQYPWGRGYIKGEKRIFEESPEALQDRLLIQNIRRDLLTSLGLGSAPKEDPWAKMFMEELTRVAQPKLELSMIGRGLGGSTVYKEAMTDLLSKLATQAALGSENLKLGRLGALQAVLLPQYQLAQNILGQLSAQEQLGLGRAGFLRGTGAQTYNVLTGAGQQNLKNSLAMRDLAEQNYQQKMEDLTRMIMLGVELAAAPFTGGLSLMMAPGTIAGGKGTYLGRGQFIPGRSTGYQMTPMGVEPTWSPF